MNTIQITCHTHDLGPVDFKVQINKVRRLTWPSSVYVRFPNDPRWRQPCMNGTFKGATLTSPPDKVELRRIGYNWIRRYRIQHKEQLELQGSWE